MKTMRSEQNLWLVVLSKRLKATAKTVTVTRYSDAETPSAQAVFKVSTCKQAKPPAVFDDKLFSMNNCLKYEAR